ncbi:hypothetical protein RhiirB3_430896 [Rhizophagus irregularis]|nr:hypothetical protein RhiirB3_430896 [Rhizophagus irregularis]
MSCSKIFSGDLPELTHDIIKYFKNDFSTLYSCILVNRLWCRLAIPLLWENPFSIPTENYNFIEIYLLNLNGELKTILNEYRIEENLIPSNTLFNYPSFIKYLNTWRIITSIEKWTEDAVRTIKPEKRKLDGFERLIHMSIYKIFTENEIKLHTLEIEIYRHPIHDPYLNYDLDLLLQYPSFFHNIKNLKLFISDSSNFLISYSNNRLSQIINLHQNLNKIVLDDNSFPLYQSLLLSKDYNCSNTLSSIILYQVNLKSIINLDKAFEQLNVLECVHIINCFLNNSFIQQIINLAKPFKLKSLFISGRSQIDELPFQLLLQKYGEYLENFGFGYGCNLTIKRELLELIMKYCKNIKFFESCEHENQIIYLVFGLIENINQNLNHLSIDVCETLYLDNRVINNNIERSSIILRNLGQSLPLNLEYLSLILNINNLNDFEIFLKNSQNNFFKKLLIHNKGAYDILPYVKEYIMKKRRVNYLAILDSFESIMIGRNFYNKDLFLLEDEVNEFGLYNIKIIKYYDLAICSKLNFIFS